MKKQVSIIGCGWLGLPLAKKLTNRGYLIKGSTTTEEKLETLKKAFIDGFIVQIDEKGIHGDYKNFLAGSETLIINIPPGLRKNPSKNHLLELKHFISKVKTENIKNILYISSTSVFEDEEHFPIINKSTKPNAKSNSGQQLIAIEKMLQDNTAFNTTILRFGGLFDAKRHPAKFLSGRYDISNPHAPINLIHKEDCISIIEKILENNIWNITLNAVYPKHTEKQIYYTYYCVRHNLPLPRFDLTNKSKGKLVDSSKLVQLLNYSFRYTP